jgi:hypothetical protein
MINKSLDIIEGWYNTINSQGLTVEQKEIANNRASVCSTCEYKGKVVVLGITYNEGCTDCGCPFPQKLYSFRKTNKCNQGKW